MFDRLIEFLIEMWDKLICWFIVKEYEKGVLLRWGKFKKIVGPGIHWKIPFADEPVLHTVVTTTMPLEAQSLTTKDGECIVVKAIIKYDTKDVKTLILDVYDPIDAIADMTQGIIKQVITTKTWDECREAEVDSLITKKAKNEAEKWGLNIQKVTLTTLGKIRSIRLIGDRNVATNLTT